MKRFLLLSGIMISLFAGAFTASAQIPNGDFEKWTAGTPDNWWTNSSIAIGAATVSQSSTKHSGSFAARGDVVSILTGIPYAVQLTTGTTAGGFAISQRPGSIVGFYEFFPLASSGDRFSIIASLFKGGLQGTGVGAGAVTISAGASSYTQFTLPIQYLTADVPDLCIITVNILGPSTSSSTPHAGSYFLLDDLALSAATSGVGDLAGLPQSFALEQNYPNPFNPSTNIRFSVAQTGHVSLKVYNVLGVEVATLVNEQRDAGTYSTNWNAAGFPSGMYLYRMSVTSDKGQVFEQAKKLVLLK